MAYLALSGLWNLLTIPAFVLFLKAVLAIAASVAVLAFFLWAVGEENKARIDELRRICEEDR